MQQESMQQMWQNVLEEDEPKDSFMELFREATKM